jgi:hypothetical protein
MSIFSGLPVLKLRRQVRIMSDIPRWIRQLDAQSSAAWARGDHDQARALRARANELRATLGTSQWGPKPAWHQGGPYGEAFHLIFGPAPSTDGGG